MRSILSIATIAGAALLVSACGGSNANNSANAAVVDNGTMMSNDAMAPDMNAPMPTGNDMNGSSMNSTTTTTTAPGGNTTTTTTNTTTANHM